MAPIGDDDLSNTAFIGVTLAKAFVASEYGMTLTDRWPVGSLHRANFPLMQKWSDRYKPTMKRRTPKKRRRK